MVSSAMQTRFSFGMAIIATVFVNCSKPAPAPQTSPVTAPVQAVPAVQTPVQASVQEVQFSNEALVVEGIKHMPAAEAPVPVLIIAPGGGYHMQLPLIKQLAEAGAAENLAVVRFDWPYHTNGARPSDDLSAEEDALALVLAQVLEDPAIDPSRVYLAGKSIGSRVAYRLFQRSPNLAALLLLTPVCTGQGQADKPVAVAADWYPDLKAESRPVLFISGQSDPLCSQPMLAQHTATAGDNITVVSVPGDHGFNLGDFRDPAFAEPNQANLTSIIGKALGWLKVRSEG